MAMAIRVWTFCAFAFMSLAGCSESSPLNEMEQVPTDSSPPDTTSERIPTSRVSFEETSLGEFGGPLFAFHSRDGERQTVVLANGEVWFRPFSECLGRQQVHAGRLQPEAATRLFDEVDALEAAEDLWLTTCRACVHCGFQRLKLAREDRNVALQATPSFRPQVECAGTEPTATQFPTKVQSVVERLAEIGSMAQEFDTVTPNKVRIGVIHLNEWRRAYRPPTIPWNIAEVSLGQVLGDATPFDALRETVVSGELASSVWATCEIGQASWPDDFDGLDANPCNAEQVFLAEEAGVTYMVACSAQLD